MSSLIVAVITSRPFLTLLVGVLRKLADHSSNNLDNALVDGVETALNVKPN